MSVCLAAGGAVKALQIAAFTLAWTHSVEKTAWQEDWVVADSGLRLVAARIKGSGAGMDPPPDARLIDGWWAWRPDRAPLPEIVLANSGAAGEWRICTDSCRTLADILGVDVAAPITRVTACSP
jgi:hypothetical protein